MTRDTVDPDPVVDRSERLGLVTVSARCPGAQARLPPHWMALEDLPGLFPLAILPLIIAPTMAAVHGPSGHQLCDVSRTLWGSGAPGIAH
jgi:hypothetical protein